MAGKRLIVLAAGGTGGHVFPAEALARELMQRGHRLALVTDRRGDAYGGALGEIDTHRIRAGGIAGKGPLAKVRSVAELGLGTLQARALLKDLKPSAVVGFGGYASIPTMMAAGFAGISTVLHEQNAILGRANRLLAGRARAIAVSFPESLGIPANAESKVTHTGMPVRTNILEVRDTPYPTFTDDKPFNVLVLGGSQGAHVLSEVIPEAMGRLAEKTRKRLSITQQCRPEDLENVRGTYKRLGIDAELASFFDDVPARLATSHLVISRSGASTVAELLAVGRPALLVPYRYAIDDHQSLNAHAVDEVGAGWLIPEVDFTAESLASRLESMFGMPMILEKAAEAARKAGRPDATERLATLVEAMLDGENGADAREAA
ncbi:MAG: undecaprenyldiphospho-muramoylpentapeptide beta-N-acetylglucosaminyltransferase [Rhodospirillales bacterium]|nr:undecaprenyldiphospho-muramoylpentapeptide beta-N-acetylglucosaminyltransferase [Rhodospirillales bacterium]MBO6787227.1 undecaprenyldiphospho-muramoylpentapeptide beta-N-acetylglucosaminyltransferase [Rhodospirillales bacterium]